MVVEIDLVESQIKLHGFQTISFTENSIPTVTFLNAADGIVQLFGYIIDKSTFEDSTNDDMVLLFFNDIDILGSNVFAPVKSDISGNVKKLRDRYAQDEANSATLQQLIFKEQSSREKQIATDALLWLSRGLKFTSTALLSNLNHPQEELTKSFEASYEKNLQQHHNIFVRPIFYLVLKAVPYRRDFYEKIGMKTPEQRSLLEQWVRSMETQVAIIERFYKANNLPSI